MKPIARSFVCDIPVYEPGRPAEEVAREHGLDPRTIIKLASNENPLGPSPRAIAAMRAAATTAHRYPDGGAFYLRRALADQLGVAPDHLVFGNGSNELIEFLFHAFVGPGDEVIVGDRAFVIYKFMTRMFQARCVEVPFRRHTHDLPAMLAAVTSRTRLVFVASPNNPTGTRVTNRALASFVRRLPAHVLLVLDEAYHDFLEDPPPAIRYAQRHQVVVLRTFSKMAGLAGLRIGYGIARPEIIRSLERVRQPFNCNAIAQAAALAALRDHAHVRRTRALTTRGLAMLMREFETLGLEYLPSCANFIMVRVGDGAARCRALQQQGIIVRPMDGYQMPDWIRVSIGTMRENRALVRALASGCGSSRAKSGAPQRRRRKTS